MSSLRKPSISTIDSTNLTANLAAELELRLEALLRPNSATPGETVRLSKDSVATVISLTPHAAYTRELTIVTTVLKL